MNYYELSNTVTPDTIGYKNGLWQKRYVQIYRVLTVVWSVLTLCLLFGMFHRDDYSSGMIKSCLLLFFAGIIFLVLMLIAVVNISAKRTENWSLQDRHDYNLAMYRTRYRNNRQLQSIVLIVMAKQQLLMSNYDLAAQALAMVDINCVKLPYLRDYYFCNAAVLFLCDKPGWQEWLDKCYAVPANQKQMTDMQIGALFLSENAKMDLCQAIYADTRIKHKWPTEIVVTAILVLYAGIFYGVGGLLSRGYHYRYWFELSSVLITYAGCMVLSLYWIIRWILFSDSVSKKSGGVRLFRKVILIVMWLCLMAAMVINLIISFIGMDTEKKAYANGLICMSTSDGYSTDEYYNIKVGPFLRRSLTFKETIKFGLINYDDSTDDSGNDAGDSGANDSESSTENNSQQFNNGSENTENENAGNENAGESLDTESKAVYDYMAAAGILSAGDAGIIRNGSNAKGTFYSVFETGEADGSTYENRLVYDRVSENGQCDLFVYEQLVSGSDTRLLGFYAVNKTTNEVFSADRNSWGGVSSREYQDATGEN